MKNKEPRKGEKEESLGRLPAIIGKSIAEATSGLSGIYYFICYFQNCNYLMHAFIC